jgi:hypothetical protein
VSFADVPAGRGTPVRLKNVINGSLKVTSVSLSSRKFWISGVSRPAALESGGRMTFAVGYQ